MDELRRKASSLGLEVVDNEGRGNCQFEALAHQLQLLLNRPRVDHQVVREKVVTYLKNNPTKNGEHQEEFLVDIKWGPYLENMAKYGTWGDHITLQAAADFFQIRIRIVSNLHENLLCPNVIAGPDITIGHVLESHYVSLIPTDDHTAVATNAEASDIEDDRSEVKDGPEGGLHQKHGDEQIIDSQVLSPSIAEHLNTRKRTVELHSRAMDRVEAQKETTYDVGEHGVDHTMEIAEQHSGSSMTFCTRLTEHKYQQVILADAKTVQKSAQYQCTNRHCRKSFPISSSRGIRRAQATHSISKLRAMRHICTKYKLAQDHSFCVCVICARRFQDSFRLVRKKSPLNMNCLNEVDKSQSSSRSAGTKRKCSDSVSEHEPFAKRGALTVDVWSKPMPKSAAIRRAKLLKERNRMQPVLPLMNSASQNAVESNSNGNIGEGNIDEESHSDQTICKIVSYCSVKDIEGPSNTDTAPLADSKNNGNPQKISALSTARTLHTEQSSPVTIVKVQPPIRREELKNETIPSAKQSSALTTVAKRSPYKRKVVTMEPNPSYVTKTECKQTDNQTSRDCHFFQHDPGPPGLCLDVSEVKPEELDIPSPSSDEHTENVIGTVRVFAENGNGTAVEKIDKDDLDDTQFTSGDPQHDKPVSKQRTHVNRNSLDQHSNEVAKTTVVKAKSENQPENQQTDEEILHNLQDHSNSSRAETTSHTEGASPSHAPGQPLNTEKEPEETSVQNFPESLGFVPSIHDESDEEEAMENIQQFPESLGFDLTLEDDESSVDSTNKSHDIEASTACNDKAGNERAQNPETQQGQSDGGTCLTSEHSEHETLAPSSDMTSRATDEAMLDQVSISQQNALLANQDAALASSSAQLQQHPRVVIAPATQTTDSDDVVITQELIKPRKLTSPKPEPEEPTPDCMIVYENGVQKKVFLPPS